MRRLSLLLLPATLAFADFSFEQRSQVTGGAMAGMMKLAGTFSKKLREPMATWTHVKGNRIAYVTGTSTMVYDIDAETITQVDHEKRTYSVMTFAQMREAMANLNAQMKRDAEVDTQIQVDVKETGRKKQIAGASASEFLMSFVYAMKDKKGKQTAEMETQSSSWLATNVAGWKEFQAAQQRLGAKMAGGSGQSPFAGGGMSVQPGMSESWAVLAAKLSKMEGVPLLQVVRMGPQGQLPAASTMGEAKPAATPEAEAGKPKAGDVLAGALGGRLGGFGRRRKESTNEKEQMPQKRTEPAAAEGGMLMEMTIETLSFNSSPVDAAKLAVPAGFQQVENEMLKRRR